MHNSEAASSNDISTSQAPSFQLILIRKTAVSVKSASSSFMFLVRIWPLVAPLIIIAAKEEGRCSQKKAW